MVNDTPPNTMGDGAPLPNAISHRITQLGVKYVYAMTLAEGSRSDAN